MSKENLVKYLQLQTIFSDLDIEHIKVLAKLAKEWKFTAGEFLFKQMDTASHFYFVRDGLITVEVPS